MSARDEILGRVRAALTDVQTAPGAGADPVASAEVAVGATTPPGATRETLELFAENVADYRATVVRVDSVLGEVGVGSAVAGALRDRGCASAVVPGGLDPAWREAVAGAVEIRDEADAATPQVLDQVDAVVTASAVGIATTGTIVLHHGADQGRRELTLVPDTHVCVIRADQVVRDVPEAVARLRTESGQQPALTWISGPSATSDIELQRVEGVHGPRNLIVVIVSTDTVS
ncbi:MULTISPECIES: LutC/YkgG family protein [unclassified Knoellia]|uniref:LutC/YkgG family protein n=1 Tax=Knoellia altitudinis TaxID=3404795 RepID=UPI0036206486